MGHWCKMDDSMGPHLFAFSTHKATCGLILCLMYMNEVEWNVGCPPCKLVLSFHISALHPAH